VLGGDPRSTVGGGSAAMVLDVASDGTEIISASAAVGLANPKTTASAAIAKGLGWRARSLVKIGMARRGAVLEARMQEI